MLLDQSSKLLARHLLHPGEMIGSRFLGLTLVRNGGVSFSLFSHSGVVLVAATSLLAAMMFVATRPTRSRGERHALAIAIAGGLSNQLDRALSHDHAVTDFLSVGSWYVCNLADVAITVGLMSFALLLSKRSKTS